MTDEPRTIIDDADDAYDAILAICHRMPASTPGPTVYRMLGNLKHAGGFYLEQALTGLGDGLVRALHTHDVYEDDDSDPAVSVAKARERMQRAAQLARQIGELLSEAQADLNRQGYRAPGHPGYRKPGGDDAVQE